MNNPTLDIILTQKRTITTLNNSGYKTYNDIKLLSLEELLAIPGMGEVSARTVIQDLERYKDVLYAELLEKTKRAADLVGVEKVIETVDSLIK